MKYSIPMLAIKADTNINQYPLNILMNGLHMELSLLSADGIKLYHESLPYKYG